MTTSPLPTSHVDVRRLLIADDDPDLRAILRLLVTRDPGPALQLVAEADTGAEAIALAEAHAPDAILLDVHMPELDGLAALPRLRAACPRARIVMHSADPSRRAEALRAGAHAWATKGAPWHELRALLTGEGS